MNKVQSRVGSSTFHEIRRRQGSSMQRESEPDTLSVPSDSERIAVIHDASVYRQRTGARQRPKAYSGVHMPTNIRQFRCEHVSATEAGEGFQVLFETVPDSDEGYVLVQRHFEFPDGGECYVETEDREFCGHFPIRHARLSRNRFEIAFGRSPVREIAVSFEATDSDYTEVKRVLQIMIPPLVIS
jgi:hypothetical protein